MKLTDIIIIIFFLGATLFLINTNFDFNALKCPLGIMLYTPLVNFQGNNIPIPSLDDLLITLFIFTIVFWFLKFFKIHLNLKKKILLFVVLWILIKILAWYFIISSLDCIKILKVEEETTKLLDIIQLFLVPILVLWVLYILYKK